MLDMDNGPRTPPATTVARPVVSREEFLFRYYIDLATESCKYGEDLEEEMAETKAELQELGKWPDVIAYFIYLEEEKMKIEEARVARLERLAELDKEMDEKREAHKLKIATMHEAALRQMADDKARVLAKLAARQVATVKDGEACKYYRNNGTPEPAREGWNEGCDYHKQGKCKHVHPDEPGWDAAVAKRKAPGHNHGHKSGHYHKKPAGGAGRW